jgi:adenylate kinase
LVENKKIILVGIPGVGKTTLLTTMVEILKDHKKNVVVINYGSLMFDVAKENGLTDRDQLRKLSVSEQQRLQKLAAEQISNHEEEVVIIDPHAFINSPEGY